MVADFLQQDLVEEIKRLFDGALFRTPGEPDEDGNPKMSALNVFAQGLPILKSESPTDEDMDVELMEEGIFEPFPYILVKIDDGAIKEIGGEQSVNMFMIMGAYDNSLENQGHKDVLHMINKICERFLKNPILAGKYEAVMPFEWALQEEESYPYFFGGLNITFNTLPVEREDPYI